MSSVEDANLKLNAIYQVNEALRELPELGDFSKALVAETVNALGASICTFTLWDEKGNLTRVAEIGPGTDDDHFMNLEKRITLEAIEKMSPIRRTDDFLVGEELFCISAPLRLKDKAMGALLVCSLHPLSQDDERFLSALAGQAALSIETNKLRERIGLETTEFFSIVEIGKAINSVLDLNELLNLICRIAIQLVRGETSSVMLLDNLAGELTIEAACGLDEDIIRRAKVKLGEQIAGWVAEKGIPLLLTDVTKDTRFKNLTRKKRKIKSALCVPLKKKEEIIGVLSVDIIESDYRFSEEDLELLSILAEQAAVAIENARSYAKVQDLYLNTIRALTLTVEARESYTKGHSQRVSDYAVAIARKLGLARDFIEVLQYAGLLHDVGKITIDEGVLLKPGALTAKEREIIETHPHESVRILESIIFLNQVIPIIRHHHERYDGRGYVDKLGGENIPIGSRILAVADAFEAMTSERSYRPALTVEQAVAELKKCSGTQFDPKIVEVFLSIIE
ncbi:MAG: GAF domain-containing protein [Actinomycetota bacterium]|nr:GAF domain-containing protein [Actinomycetota bacterium]